MSDNHISHKTMLRRTALSVVAFYILIAALWILLSDAVVAWVVTDQMMLTRVQTAKGWLFVLVTGALLYAYLRSCLQKMQKLEESREASVREQFEQMTILFDAFNAIIYVADLKTYELLYVNKYAAEMFGQDWPGKVCYKYLQAGQTTPCDFCTNHLLLKDGVPGPAVTWEFQNTSNKRWYECLDKAIQWTDGRLVRFEIAIDITERKELETTKDEILSSVSHEMRTPLTAITGFVELLLDDETVPPHVTKHLQIIFRESEKMVDLVNTFLDVRRFKTNRARVGYEIWSVASIIEDGLKNTRDCQEHHQISVTCPGGLEVFGNRKELAQTINQLVANACRYSPEGGPIHIQTSEKNGEIVISVRDQGVGIDQQEQEEIFERFYRLDRGDTRRTGGVGLGLAVVKEIVELHGGRIWLESAPGKGSCFYLALPYTSQLLSKAPTTVIAGTEGP